MRERLCSSWTVTLNYQTFTALAAAFRQLGNTDRAAELEAMAAGILDEFQRVLDRGRRRRRPRLFPRGRKNRLPAASARRHHRLVLQPAADDPRHHQRHVHPAAGGDPSRPDPRASARPGRRAPVRPADGLSRRPADAISSGPRAPVTSAARSASCTRTPTCATARRSPASAMRRASSTRSARPIPIAIRELVPSAAPRQANCYYSSSDAAFADRYEAFDDYDKVKRGEVAAGRRLARLFQRCGHRRAPDHAVFPRPAPGKIRAGRRSGHPAGTGWLDGTPESRRPPGRGDLSHQSRAAARSPSTSTARRLDFIREDQPLPPGRRPHPDGIVDRPPDRHTGPTHHFTWVTELRGNPIQRGGDRKRVIDKPVTSSQKHAAHEFQFHPHPLTDESNPASHSLARDGLAAAILQSDRNRPGAGTGEAPVRLHPGGHPDRFSQRARQNRDSQIG